MKTSTLCLIFVLHIFQWLLFVIKLKCLKSAIGQSETKHKKHFRKLFSFAFHFVFYNFVVVVVCRTHDLIQFKKNEGKTRSKERKAGKASQVKCQATQRMCGMAWQIYLTAAVATAKVATATTTSEQQCELKFIWGLTIRKQHRDDKLFGHQAQNLHANKSFKRDGWGRKVWGAVCER